jgi:hypothetical protein
VARWRTVELLVLVHDFEVSVHDLARVLLLSRTIVCGFRCGCNESCRSVFSFDMSSAMAGGIFGSGFMGKQGP